MSYPKGRKYTTPRRAESYLKSALTQQKPLPNEPELRRLYFDEKLSMRAIAARFNVVPATISNRFRFLGIKAKGSLEDGHPLFTVETAPRRPRTPYSHKATYLRIVFEKELRPPVCVRCGSTRNIEVHHLDENHSNNATDNLVVICRSCHRKAHDTAQFLPSDRGWSKRRE